MSPQMAHDLGWKITFGTTGHLDLAMDRDL